MIYKGFRGQKIERNVHFIGGNIMQYILNEDEYNEYKILKYKNTPMKKVQVGNYLKCPVCGYIVDNNVPTQKYCDNCGQRLRGSRGITRISI